MKKINYRKFSFDLRNCYEIESDKSYTVRGAIDHLRKPGTGFTAHIG